jgi:hypothetical protein
MNAEYTKTLRLSPGAVELPAGSQMFVIGWLADATTQFSQALALDPSYHLAALHLGRVRMLQNNKAEAARLFSSTTRAHDPRVSYLASLFLGRFAERDDRYEEAEQLYRDAAARYPSGQAATLALSQLLSQTSRETDAREVLMVLLAKPRGHIVEPLWTYLRSPVLELDEVLGNFAELRAEVMK